MGKGMVRIGYADLRVGAIAGFPGELKSGYTGHVALKRENLQVEHQSRVVGVGGRNAQGAVEVGELVPRGVGLGRLNAAFHFAYCGEVFFEFCAIGVAEVALKAGDFFADRIEQAGTLSQRVAAFLGGAAFAEQAFKDDSRMGLGRQRRGRGGPGKVVLIDAGVTIVALTDELEQIHRHFQRRQLG